MDGLAGADYAVIFGFFVVMVAIGLYFHRKMRNISDYFGGGKRVPWWLAGISFYMCSFSALSFVIYSELAYKYGWTSVTLFWVTAPAVFFGAQLFAQRWRRVAETSPLEFIEHRFGIHMRQGLVWLQLPGRILDDGMKLYAIGTVVTVGMGLRFERAFELAVIVSGVIMLSYTFTGGLWAVLVADFIQFIVLLSAVIVLPILAFQMVEGGVGGFVEQAPAGFFRPLSEDYSLFFLLIWFFMILLSYNTSWALVQRYYSSDSDKSARKVGYLMTFLSFISPPIFFIPAMVARVSIPDIANTAEVYPTLCKMVLPIGMLGMIIAAMFAATMSMVAGDFNAISSVLTNDVYKRLIGRKTSDRKLLLIGRINTLVISILVVSFAFMIHKIKSEGGGDLFNIMVKIASIFLIPTAIPILLGMLTRRVSRVAGLVGLYCAISAGIICFVLVQWEWLAGLCPEGLIEFLGSKEGLPCVTFSTSLLFTIIGSKIWPDRGGQLEKVNKFFEKADKPSAEPVPVSGEDADAGQIVSPFPIIGLGVIAIGLVLIVAVLVSVPLAEARLSLIVGSGMILVGAAFCWLAYRSRKKERPF